MNKLNNSYIYSTENTKDLCRNLKDGGRNLGNKKNYWGKNKNLEIEKHT